jgi:hypothetical protein
MSLGGQAYCLWVMPGANPSVGQLKGASLGHAANLPLPSNFSRLSLEPTFEGCLKSAPLGQAVHLVANTRQSWESFPVEML